MRKMAQEERKIALLNSHRKWEVKNRKKRNEQHRKYRAEHLEEYRKRDREAKAKIDKKKRYEDHLKWAREHPDRIKEYDRKRYAKRFESLKEYRKKWREEHPEKCMEYRKKRQAEHREEINEHSRKKYREKIEQAIMHRVIQKMFASWSCGKTSQAQKYIGCSPGFLRNHLESLFRTGVSWDNYGEWHVDHIVPLSWFPLREDESLLFVASHWTNLQPMWGKDNMSKGNRRVE